MRQKYIRFFSLALASATAGFSQITLNTVPTRAIGQPQLALVTANPNLIEGRELYSPQGLALDTAASPPILYVADTNNNRVLAWKNAASFSNGAKADLVLGQHDFFTTNPQGPGTSFQTGLNSPTGLAVFNGDLYIVDSGNNRVLRFRKPFEHLDLEFPDMYLGQPNLNSRSPNYTGAVNAKGIVLSANNQTFRANVAFDSSGNLWLTDPGNRRVLRFGAQDVAAGGGPLTANLQIGQGDFNSVQPNLDSSNPGARLTRNQFAVPSGIAFDAAGRLYVSDSDPSNPVNLSRVLVFSPIFFSGMSAVRLLGVIPPVAPGSTPPSQTIIQKTIMGDPEGIFFLPDGNVGVVDNQNSRILIFPPYDQWGTESSLSVSPTAVAVIGQSDFTGGNFNTGSFRASPGAFAFPVAAAFAGNSLYVADTLNNRVLMMPYQNGTVQVASRVLGQDRLDTNAVNLIEGREFHFVLQTTLGVTADAGVIVDSTDPNSPHLFVADPYNNRVLGFRDLRKAVPGSKADIVIGQPDMQTSLCNYNQFNVNASSPNQPNQFGLCTPVGLAVDTQGNLYVADSGNARVLRFPKPFAGNAALPMADLVLGQQDFSTKITDPSARTMNSPYGIAFAGDRGLLVSDVRHNRVLFFPATNGSFTSGESATKVFGQPDFFTIDTGSDDAHLNAPRHIGADTDTRLYVADTGNNRVLIFDRTFSAASFGAHAAQTISNLSAPRSVFVSPLTGEAWVTDSNNNRILRYPRYDALVLNNASTATLSSYSPVAAALDQYGDLFAADAANRITIYFPGLQALNGASYLPTRSLAPGMFASLCAPGSNCTTGLSVFGQDTAQAQSFPLPLVLADTQVLFNGQPARLWAVSPSQINFLVPMGQKDGDIPTSGTADFQVVKVSTGQIVAAGFAQMNVASPGIFQQNFTGTNRQALVVNQDNSLNTPSNPAPRGSVIQIWATGAGFIPGAPADGTPATAPTSTPNTPEVIIGICRVDDQACTQEPPGHVQYSGLNGYPGVWQINVKIPQNTAPGTQVPLVVLMNGFSSTDANSGFRTVINVGQ